MPCSLAKRLRAAPITMKTSVIRTPDQRLRVFVSSTLGELAPERRAVRQAIERLRLIPVMFELGARSHPPRELYRAYVGQSHVFVGIYWQRYGWVASGEAISGLEDEYRLAGDLPRLLYIKEPSPDREPRLSALFEDFQADDRASYKRFASIEELAELVAEDLAVMLSERFAAETAEPDVSHDLPIPLTETLGRDDDVGEAIKTLGKRARLLTLTGPGGIGKTRLALEVAHRVAGSYPDGVYFVPLASVGEVQRALSVIAERLGVRPEGRRAPLDAVAEYARGKRVLLVLDNIEQIANVESAIVSLLERAPALRILATSRRALRVRPEQELSVRPLALPELGLSVPRLALNPAVRLFVDRAAAVTPGFALTDENAPVIAELCRRVDGLPLAIELAAARTRVLSPRALLDRLGQRLDVLAGGSQDLPERQRTLRATIDWSHALLDGPESELFARLSAFSGGWNLEAADAVCSSGTDDIASALGSLLDKSLVVAEYAQASGDPRFGFLETVHRYASERLEARGETETYRRRHLDWCRALAHRAQPSLCGPGQSFSVELMDRERANVRRAVATGLELREHGAIVELAWDLVVYYFVRDAVDEPDTWLRQVAASHPELDQVTNAKLRSLLALTRIHHGDYSDVHRSLLEPCQVFRRRGMDFELAVVLHQLGFVRYRLDDDIDGAVAALRESSQLFQSVGHDWGVALAEAMLGSVLASIEDLDGAERCQRRSLAHAQRIGSDQQVVQALQQLALVGLLDKREDDALALLRDAAPLVLQHRYRTEASYGLDALAVIALTRDDVETAARAVTVAAAVRGQLGIEPWPTLDPFIERIRRGTRRRLGVARYEEMIRQGQEADPFEALEEIVSGLAMGTNR
ncbi:MAG: DUF4062 domain-containing protein [Polyangiales bacterium]